MIDDKNGKNLSEYKKRFDKLYITDLEDLYLGYELRGGETEKEISYELPFNISIYQIQISIHTGDIHENDEAFLALFTNESIADRSGIPVFQNSKHMLTISKVSGKVGCYNDYVSFDNYPILLRKGESIHAYMHTGTYTLPPPTFSIIIKYRKEFE